MKAKSLLRKSAPIELIYEDILRADENGHFKQFVPHFIHVKDEIISQLIKDGFKVYRGDWDMQMINCLIIEW